MTITKKKTWILWSCVAAVVLLTVVFSVLYFLFRIPLFDRSGWVITDAGAVGYQDYFGRALKKWQRIDGEWYYFDPADAVMHTGWLTAGEDRYYLDPEGVMYTGWLETEDGRYFFDDSGILHTGWLQTNNGRYFFNEDGVMETGWLEDGDARYYLRDTGSMAVGWMNAEGQRYYFDESGVMQTGWQTVEGKRYYLRDDGVMHTGWLEQDGYEYYFNELGSMITGPAEVDGIKQYFAPNGQHVVLVNHRNPVPEWYGYDLVDIQNFQVDASCRDALEELLNACENAGYSCELNSVYRSISTQQKLWDNRYYQYIANGYSEGTAYRLTQQVVAIPGTSEHQLGLAADLIGTEELYAWLAEHSWEYGFILRYPEDKTEITGIVYEPWHFRYVGKELAQQIYDSGLCLEEFLGEQGNI